MNKLFVIISLLLYLTDVYAATAGKQPHGAESKTFTNSNLTLTLRIQDTKQGAYLLAKREDPPHTLLPDSLSVILNRMGGNQEIIEFEPYESGLRSKQFIAEPHSFVATIALSSKDDSFSWEWQKHEARTEIVNAYASQAGITTTVATGGEIKQHTQVYGQLTVPPQQRAEVHARFAGIVEQLFAGIGQTVKAGEQMARVQSNDSLQAYDVKAPIAGLVISRNMNIGELTSTLPLFAIVDTSVLWAQLMIFPSQRNQVAEGKSVHIIANGRQLDSTITSIIPSTDGQPYQLALVKVMNKDGKLSPGDLVTGIVDSQQKTVPVKIENRAIQTLNNKPVVFLNEGNAYQATPVTLGLQDDNYSEVVAGLSAGQTYVVDNSFLIKADIQKSGASHAH
ncbi:efflux RND transporter periplasmic adaptor subunit [Salinimonas sediminis]|uniref:HlyD family efflux transporter periplasmic adaptor subunit n=1 Tax=Salinimonas sediminis TaxID=2303538 RepID=A0A346NJ63_9ALTE|nr:efflux RND transporter periplasmic adaptor subunit [Salinimonas sediminis]AXR05570.1 HlyD family efflux transporter periplasmic adaptor subunit [Salinimonas sediminis]